MLNACDTRHMCPATTPADVERHTVAFREAVVALYA